MTNENLRKLLDLPKLREHNDDMAPLIALLPGDAVVAELGVFSGEVSVQFLASPKLSRLICVDNWVGGYATNDIASAADMEAAYDAFCVRVNKDPRVVVFHCHTVAAAGDFADKSIDLVYIDADHSFAAVSADLKAWMPKVKPGGYIAGHDYGSDVHTGVKQAVDMLVPQPIRSFPDSSWASQL